MYLEWTQCEQAVAVLLPSVLGAPGVNTVLSRAGAAKVANAVWSESLAEGPLQDTYHRAIEKVRNYENRAGNNLSPEQLQTLKSIKDVLRQHQVFIE